ncbi:chemotaxis protein CheW [Deferrisoma camini]|uniref:chemotaxis protein CheW n=1 Tax=Deferrisoma camini TaxID=1035120 RepID=UPI0004A33DC7|nr:chemotaxis protein CheW [Deferrisoma camini]
MEPAARMPTGEGLGDSLGEAQDPSCDDGAVRQYVTCLLGEERFAFPMESVLEIVRLPETVRVPLAPPSLKGLANLRGTVLPVVDLRGLLGLPGVEPTDATRVVVIDCSRPAGLVVDRVERVLSVEGDRVEPATDVSVTVDSALLAGVIRSEEDGALIQLLDGRALVGREFEAFCGPCDGGLQPAATAASARPAGTAEEPEDDGWQLVSFEVDAEEYAFDIAEVREIVRVPDEISRVPGAGEHVLGIIDLRGRVLPLVSLRRLFGLADAPVEEHNRILVVGLAEGDRQVTVGMVVDRVHEVFQVGADALDEVPELLAKQGVEGVQALCRLEGGRRLVSLLSAEALFQHPAVKEAVETHGEDAMQTEERGSASGAEEKEELQFVVFQLAGQEYGVGIEWVQEIIWVPDQMSHVPKAPEFIEGMVNLRGTVLPVVDMRARFGLERMERNDRQRILVLNLDGTRTGFVVDAMSEVLRVPARAVEEAPRLSEDQARIMGRVVNLKEQGRMIQVIEARELLEADEREAVARAASEEAAA